MARRFFIASGVVIVLLVAAIGIVYTFGTPQAPPAAAAMRTAPPSADAQVDPSAASPAAEGVPAPDPNVPLAIQIPGCKCHSDDPQLVEEHSKYRMNQCGGCHGGKTPTGQ